MDEIKEKKLGIKYYCKYRKKRILEYSEFGDKHSPKIYYEREVLIFYYFNHEMSQHFIKDYVHQKQLFY